jgi:soluble lytic murein transglycosylase-like protein
MIPCLLAAVVILADSVGPAAAEVTLWTNLADTSATANAASWAANPAAPAVDDSGRVAWGAAAPRHEERRALTLRRLTAPDAPGDTLALARRWLMLSMPGVPGLPLYALRRAAPLFLAAGDSARADSCWAALAEGSGLWRWESVRSRAQLALARGAPSRADSILGELEHRELGVNDRAAWLALRARAAAAAFDTARALELCRQVVRVSPALPPATEAETLLDTLVAARGDTLSYADLDDLADVDALRGDRDGAALRLERAFAVAPASDRFRAGLKYAEALRLDRRYDRASLALDSLARLGVRGEARAQVLLERARVERDARHPDPALHLYGQAVKASHDSSLIATALWERAREAEQEQKQHQARSDYQRLASLGRGRAADATFRAGLLWYVGGNSREAARWWGRSDSEAARFWRAIALRPTRRAEADSLLGKLAARPGYSFYIAAARETLGVRGWPGGAAVAPAGMGEAPALALATLLVEGGLGDDGADLAARWAGGEARDTLFGPVPPARRAASLIAAAQVAFEAGRIPQGIRLAQRALTASADSGDARRWALVPWIFPPAYESLVRWRTIQADDPEIDPALLSALIWQESRFDAAARSRSNALGLMQLMLGTARRTLGARAVPAESSLFDPALNTAAGTRYLQGLLARFGGNVPAALAAYNSGPNRVLQHWLELSRRHGDALFCELIVFPETEDYVKKIMAVRSAYRELAPQLIAGASPP